MNMNRESDRPKPIAFACHNCKRQKKRCDLVRPCPRCTSKGIDCVPYQRPVSQPSSMVQQPTPTMPIAIPRRTLSPPQNATPELDFDYPDSSPRSYPSSPLQFWHYTNDPLPTGPFSPPATPQMPVSAPMYSQPDAFVGYTQPFYPYPPVSFTSPTYGQAYQYSPSFSSPPESSYTWMTNQEQKQEEPRTMPSLFPLDHSSFFMPGTSQGYDYGSGRQDHRAAPRASSSTYYQPDFEWPPPASNPFY